MTRGRAYMTSLYLESVVDRVTDKFDRADGAALGSTTDSHHFPWLAGDLRSNAVISGGTLLLPRQTETGDGASIGGDFLPGDLDMTVTVSGITGSGWAAICYRQNPKKRTAQYGFGMGLFMYADGKKITNGQYWYGSPVLVKEYVPPEPIDWRLPHTVRIKAQRYHQQVWLDGKEIMSYFCWFDQTVVPYSEGTAALPVGGYVGLYRGQDTAFAVDAVDIQVLGPAPDADEQRVANLEAKYRKSGAYAEGATALDDLARSVPDSKLAGLAYVGAAKLVLETNDISRAVYLIEQATRLYKLGGAVSLGVDELLVKLREKTTAANNAKDQEAIWRALYQCEMSPVRKYYSLLMAAKALVEEGGYDKALTDLEIVLAAPEVHADKPLYQAAQYLKAVTLAKAGRVDEAVGSLRASLPANASPLERAKNQSQIGDVYYKAKRYAEAIKAFKEVRNLADAPDELKVEALYHSGLCYRETGNQRSAEECMELVIKRYPESNWARQARGQLYVWSVYSRSTE